nr:type ISP restriction/modification enzyme [Hymenobacter fodinae]
MSRILIQSYQSEVEKIIRYGGSRKETSIRVAFQNLLNDYCKQKDFLLIPELDFKLPNGKTVYPDGTVKDALRLTWGYWESKDEADDLDEEIQKKFAKGYPKDNILFEDSHRAVLIQGGEETLRADLDDIEATDAILQQFLHYERPEVSTFRQAIERFRDDLPLVVESLRSTIAAAEGVNTAFQQALSAFVVLGQRTINPEFSTTEAREMMIQHILTEDIFNRIFDETQFHRENNIAHELEQVINTFFTGSTRRDTLERIRPYFDVINAQAASIASHKEKQKFLKVVYENFYQAYNPKGADKLGIVYTPNEVVRFMIESTEYLTELYFEKLLSDKGVEILDPATGTGTFITELLDYLPAKCLPHKYEHELYANEIAILPYYIANLNIEYTYKQRVGKYAEFHNICFVDTLDNVNFQKVRKGQLALNFGLGMENSARIRRQNEREISVIIGNPPYNANQQNENDHNKNRSYPAVDKRIKDTYIKHSTAQKTKAYDMYSRFFRWASDRLADEGLLCFITNSSFIHSRTFDGFRKSVANEFAEIYLVDLGGDVRSNPKLSGTKHNVFGIQAGVAIGFFVKRKKKRGQQAKIYYLGRAADETAADKLTFLHESKFGKLEFDRIRPDAKGNWLNITKNNWDDLLPLVDNTSKDNKEVLFTTAALGVNTARDEWVYDFDKELLAEKAACLVQLHNESLATIAADKKGKAIRSSLSPWVKWSETLINRALKKSPQNFESSQIVSSLYRPFVKQFYYGSKYFSDRLTGSQFEFFGPKLVKKNKVLLFTAPSSSKPFMVGASNIVADLHYVGAGCGTQCLPMYRYNKAGERQSNVTEWGLGQFQTYYEDTSISGQDIFHYIYAVLHDSHYRTRYEQNLKRELPRIPFYPAFHTWATAGKELFELHLEYENAESWPLELRTTPQPHNPTTPQPHNPTTPQPHNPTTPQPHNPTTRPGKVSKHVSKQMWQRESWCSMTSSHLQECRPWRGTTNWVIGQRWNGYLTSTKRRLRKTPQFANGSTPIVLLPIVMRPYSYCPRCVR